MNKYDNESYQKIRKAITSNDFVIVEFENEDVTKFNLNYHGEPLKINSIEFNSHEVTINGDVKYPWDNIRYLTDPGFKKYVDEVGLNWAVQVGLKIKNARLKHNYTIEEVAEKLGMNSEMWRRVEEGTYGLTLSFSLIKDMLGVMNFNIRDLNIP